MIASLLTSLSLSLFQPVSLVSNNVSVISFAISSTNEVVVDLLNFDSNNLQGAVLSPIYSASLPTDAKLAGLNSSPPFQANGNSLMQMTNFGASPVQIVYQDAASHQKVGTVIQQSAQYLTNFTGQQWQFLFYTNGAFNSNDLLSSICGTEMPWMFNTNKTLQYNASQLGLSTNQSIATWPFNLSFLGENTPYGYEVVLISSNLIATQQHLAGLVGQTISWMDTNGVIYSSTVTNAVNLFGDADIGELGTPIPPTVIPCEMAYPWIVTNFSSGSFAGVPSLWIHRNDQRIEMVEPFFNSAFGSSSLFFYSNFVTMAVSQPNIATPGDSSSPQIFCVGTNAVLFGSCHNGGQSSFYFTISPNWTDYSIFTNLVNDGLTNSIHFFQWP